MHRSFTPTVLEFINLVYHFHISNIPGSHANAEFPLEHESRLATLSLLLAILYTVALVMGVSVEIAPLPRLHNVRIALRFVLHHISESKRRNDL